MSDEKISLAHGEKKETPSSENQILKNLKNKKFREQQEAIKALADVRDAEAINTLLDLIKSKDWNYQHRITAIRALSQNRRDKRYQEILKQIVDDPSENEELRRNAIMELSRLKDPKYIELFKRVLNDDYRFIRFWAVRGLIKIKDNKAYAALIQALGDEDEEIRKEAYLHLEHAPPSIVPYLKTAYESPDSNQQLRVGIVGLLGRLKYKDNIKILAKALNDGSDRVVRIAIRGLGKSENIKAIPILLDFWEKEGRMETAVRSALFNITQQNLNGALVIYILYYMEHRDEKIKNMILSVLERLIPDSIISLGELKTDPEISDEIRDVIDDWMEILES